jgi:hypothetical protein
LLTDVFALSEVANAARADGELSAGEIGRCLNRSMNSASRRPVEYRTSNIEHSTLNTNAEYPIFNRA